MNYSISLLKTTHTHSNLEKGLEQCIHQRVDGGLFRCKIIGTFQSLLFACPYFLIFLKLICLTFYTTKEKYF